MNIKINRLLEGAKTANGITVVIDVFRASNTIISCLSSGADYILPVGEINEARNLKLDNPDFLLLGERGGVTVEGFDSGNSPFEVSEINLSGKKVILTTSAGAQGIVYSNKADEVIIGSFANIDAVVSYIRNRNPKEVTLLAIGNNAVEKAIEDEECAVMIKSKLEGNSYDFDSIKPILILSDGASRLKRLGQTEDLHYCTTLNSYGIVPKYDKDLKRIVL